MLCDGSAISRTLYPDLFALLGTTWGAGDGSSTFNLPDFRGRFLLGAGLGTGLTNRPLAAIGDEEAHKLTVAELAAHFHTYTGTWRAGTGLASGAYTLASGENTSVTGGDTPHNTMPPFLVVTYIIKVSLTGGPTAQAPIADATQAGLMNRLSGLSADYVGGDNASHPLPPALVVSPDALWSPMNAFDDHFDAPVLDPKWNYTAGLNGPILENSGSCLHMAGVAPSTTATVVNQIWQALANQTLPLTVVMCWNPIILPYWAIGAGTASNGYAQLTVRPTGVNSGVQIRITASFAKDTQIIVLYLYCLYGSAFPSQVVYYTFFALPRYIAITVATDRSTACYFSLNGKTWINYAVITGAQSGFSTTLPGEALIQVAASNACRIMLEADWIRFLNTAGPPTS
jgi:microcystin-dependent protein